MAMLPEDGPTGPSYSDYSYYVRIQSRDLARLLALLLASTHHDSTLALASPRSMLPSTYRLHLSNAEIRIVPAAARMASWTVADQSPGLSTPGS